MTTGIYILKFNSTTKVYVGQSKNIEARYIQHKTNMRRGISPKKLLDAYLQYGLPIYEILVECTKEELDENEEEAIIIFDAIQNGFNTIKEAGFSSELFGDACGNSKYTNQQIIQVFDLLVDSPELTHAEIIKATGIPRGVVSDISRGSTHLWLKAAFPDRYEILEQLKLNRRMSRRTAKSQGKAYPIILDPQGNEYTVDNIRGFAREHDLNYSCLGRVLRRDLVAHKGWKLK